MSAHLNEAAMAPTHTAPAEVYPQGFAFPSRSEALVARAGHLEISPAADAVAVVAEAEQPAAVLPSASSEPCDTEMINRNDMKTRARRGSTFLFLIVAGCAVIAWVFAEWSSRAVYGTGLMLGTSSTDVFGVGGAAIWVATTALVAFGLGLPDGCDSKVEAWQAATLSALTSTGAVLVVAYLADVGASVTGMLIAALKLLLLLFAFALWVSAPRLNRSRVVYLLGDLGPCEVELIEAAQNTGWATQYIDQIDQATAPFGRSSQRVLVLAAHRVAEITASTVILLGTLGVTIFVPDQFAERHTGRLLLESRSILPILAAGHSRRRRYSRLQRAFDMVAGLALLPLAAIVGFALALLNPLGNRGPLLYRQKRVGFMGKEFTMLKFRSMRSEESTRWTTEDDPRITVLGRWLRRFHIDELPQAWNILRGDLSLVGPRPEQPGYAEQLSATMPLFHARVLTRPGLTGWAQIHSGYASSEASTAHKLRHDLFYVKNQSARLDVAIVLRTFLYLLKPKSR